MDPIRLEEKEYWKMFGRAADARRARQAADVTALGIEAAQAERRAIETLDVLAEKYGFDRAVEMTFDESTFSIVPVPPQTPPK
jgi:hypothetical protein